MPSTAYQDPGEQDSEGDFVPTIRDNLDGWQQFVLPNGQLIVIGNHKQGNKPNVSGSPPNLPDKVSQVVPFDDNDMLADKVKDSEAALSNHSFAGNELTFTEVFDHPELSVRSDQPYEARGMSILSEDTSYYGTSQSDWQDKWTATVPAEYEGRVKISFEYRGNTDTIGHVRVLRDGDQVAHVHTDEVDYIEYALDPETVGLDESVDFKFQLRAVDTSIDESGPDEARIRNAKVVPEFTHEGEDHWLDEVSRVALPGAEFARRVGL